MSNNNNKTWKTSQNGNYDSKLIEDLESRYRYLQDSDVLGKIFDPCKLGGFYHSVNRFLSVDIYDKASLKKNRYFNYYLIFFFSATLITFFLNPYTAGFMGLGILGYITYSVVRRIVDSVLHKRYENYLKKNPGPLERFRLRDILLYQFAFTYFFFLVITAVVVFSPIILPALLTLTTSLILFAIIAAACVIAVRSIIFKDNRRFQALKIYSEEINQEKKLKYKILELRNIDLKERITNLETERDNIIKSNTFADDIKSTKEEINDLEKLSSTISSNIDVLPFEHDPLELGYDEDENRIYNFDLEVIKNEVDNFKNNTDSQNQSNEDDFDHSFEFDIFNSYTSYTKHHIWHNKVIDLIKDKKEHIKELESQQKYYFNGGVNNEQKSGINIEIENLKNQIKANDEWVKIQRKSKEIAKKQSVLKFSQRDETYNIILYFFVLTLIIGIIGFMFANPITFPLTVIFSISLIITSIYLSYNHIDNPSIKDLKERGYDAKTLLEAEFSIDEILRVEYEISELLKTNIEYSALYRYITDDKVSQVTNLIKNKSKDKNIRKKAIKLLVDNTYYYDIAKILLLTGTNEDIKDLFVEAINEYKESKVKTNEGIVKAINQVINQVINQAKKESENKVCKLPDISFVEKNGIISIVNDPNSEGSTTDEEQSIECTEDMSPTSSHSYVLPSKELLDSKTGKNNFNGNDSEVGTSSESDDEINQDLLNKFGR